MVENSINSWSVNETGASPLSFLAGEDFWQLLTQRAPFFLKQAPYLPDHLVLGRYVRGDWEELVGEMRFDRVGQT